MGKLLVRQISVVLLRRSSDSAPVAIATVSRAQLLVYEGRWGSTKATHHMVQNVQGKDFNETQTANPASVSQCSQLLGDISQDLRMQLEENSSPKAARSVLTSSRPPEWLHAKLATMKSGGTTTENTVVAIGGDTCMFRLVHQSLGVDSWTREEVWSVITQKLCGCTDEDLEQRYRFLQAGMAIPKLVLMCAVMDVFSFPRVSWKHTNGSTQGLLLHTDYWK